MKLSIAILTHNEGSYLEQLLSSITPDTRIEIVILDDYSTDPVTLTILDAWSSIVQLHQRHLNDDFAAQKNHLNSLCSGDWILNLDADEYLTQEMYEYVLDSLIEDENTPEAVWFPRLNLVEGITNEHIQRWGWRVNSFAGIGRVIQWPDYQCRLYRNLPHIKWEKPVHEQLTGFKTYALLPAEPDYAIIHHKDIKRQEQQNAKYDAIISRRIS